MPTWLLRNKFRSKRSDPQRAPSMRRLKTGTNCTGVAVSLQQMSAKSPSKHTNRTRRQTCHTWKRDKKEKLTQKIQPHHISTLMSPPEWLPTRTWKWHASALALDYRAARIAALFAFQRSDWPRYIMSIISRQETAWNMKHMYIPRQLGMCRSYPGWILHRYPGSCGGRAFRRRERPTPQVQRRTANKIRERRHGARDHIVGE